MVFELALGLREELFDLRQLFAESFKLCLFVDQLIERNVELRVRSYDRDRSVDLKALGDLDLARSGKLCQESLTVLECLREFRRDKNLRLARWS